MSALRAALFFNRRPHLLWTFIDPMLTVVGSRHVLADHFLRCEPAMLSQMILYFAQRRLDRDTVEHRVWCEMAGLPPKPYLSADRKLIEDSRAEINDELTSVGYHTLPPIDFDAVVTPTYTCAIRSAILRSPATML